MYDINTNELIQYIISSKAKYPSSFIQYTEWILRFYSKVQKSLQFLFPPINQKQAKLLTYEKLCKKFAYTHSLYIGEQYH